MRRASYPSNNRPCQPLQHAEQPPPSLVVSIREAAAGNAATRTRMHVRKGMNKHGLGHNPQVDVCIARLQIAIRCQCIDSGTEERLIDGAVGKIPTSWRHAIARVRHSMQQRGLEGGRGRRSSSGSSGDDGGSAAAAAASVRPCGGAGEREGTCSSPSAADPRGRCPGSGTSSNAGARKAVPSPRRCNASWRRRRYGGGCPGLKLGAAAVLALRALLSVCSASHSSSHPPATVRRTPYGCTHSAQPAVGPADLHSVRLCK
jgi:hypothetical protein